MNVQGLVKFWGDGVHSNFKRYYVPGDIGRIDPERIEKFERLMAIEKKRKSATGPTSAEGTDGGEGAQGPPIATRLQVFWKRMLYITLDNIRDWVIGFGIFGIVVFWEKSRFYEIQERYVLEAENPYLVMLIMMICWFIGSIILDYIYDNILTMCGWKYMYIRKYE